MSKRWGCLERSAGVFLFTLLLGTSMWAQASAKANSSSSMEKRTARAKEIFQDYCFLCHDRASERVKPLGPSLDGLFKRKTLVVGKPVNEANIAEVIKTGPTSGMPAFRYALSDEEIGDLVEFLKTK